MEDQSSIFLERIRQTDRCRPEVEETASEMADFSTDIYEMLLQQLMANGEDKALGILLNICAVNEIKLAPNLLAETLRVVEPLTDFALPYRMQDENAIEPLLVVAQAEDISWQRQAFACRIAAELSVRFDREAQRVRNILLKLKSKMHSLETEWMIDDSLFLLEDKRESATRIELFFTEIEALSELPEEKPPVIIGDGFTVRRPIPKLSRNAPCHCGSGKKYKKCCYEKDRTTLRDASPYQGLTMTQVRSSPEMVDDAGIISEMRAYELQKLDTTRLNHEQLLAAYRRADLFGLRDLAFGILVELEKRSGDREAPIRYFEELLLSVLDAGNVALAEKILSRIPPEKRHFPETAQLNLHLIKHREYYEPLEILCRKAMTANGEQFREDPLIHLGYSLEKTYPALSIIFARAFIAGNPERHFDNETLLDTIRSARAEIGLELLEDPIEDYVEWCFDREEGQHEENWINEAIGSLMEKASEARRGADEKEKELRQREIELNELMAEIEKEKRESAKAATLDAVRSTDEHADDKGTILRLRQRIETLKGEIESQQQLRRQLRRQLQTEREKTQTHQEPEETQAPTPEPAPAQPPAKELKKVLIPEFSSGFRRSCESIPPTVVAKAIRAMADFAVRDELVWRRTKPIRRIPGFYRIRIDTDYRLMLRWEPDERLEVLDVIPRSHLKTWIRQHAA